MIIINAPMKRSEIKSLMESDFPNLEFVDEKGMKLSYVEKDGNDDEVAKAVKAAIKNTEYGTALFFQVAVQ